MAKFRYNPETGKTEMFCSKNGKVPSVDAGWENSVVVGADPRLAPLIKRTLVNNGIEARELPSKRPITHESIINQYETS